MSLLSWINADNWATLRDKVNAIVTEVNSNTKKTLVSSNDTTTGYLNGKLLAGSNIEFTENNDGSDETLTISSPLKFIKGSSEISSGNINTVEAVILTLTPSTSLASAKMTFMFQINLTASNASDDVYTFKIKKNGTTLKSVDVSITSGYKLNTTMFCVSSYAANDIITVTAKTASNITGTVPYAILLAESAGQ